MVGSLCIELTWECCGGCVVLTQSVKLDVRRYLLGKTQVNNSYPTGSLAWSFTFLTSG